MGTAAAVFARASASKRASPHMLHLLQVQQGECQLQTRDAKPVRTLEVLNLLIIAENGKVRSQLVACILQILSYS